jgi:hypothetical protein
VNQNSHIKFVIEIKEEKKKKKLPIMPTMLRANEALTIFFYCKTKTKDAICKEDEG